jgi:hypothetical protein
MLLSCARGVRDIAGLALDTAPLAPPLTLQPHRMTRFVFVTGGVVSSVGKGITVASLGRL